VFSSIWSEYKAQLGCNRSAAQEGTITTEVFQGGYLAWVKSEDLIYVIKNDGSWSVHPNGWTSGEETLPCEAARSNGYPTMGFGKLWCNDVTVNSSLGTPLYKEEPDNYAEQQIFESGQIFRTFVHSGVGKTLVLFVLLNDGTGRVI
jgi:hypothetical protein